MNEQITFDENGEYKFPEREPIKGFPELRWTGKRPFKSTMYFPAQLKESYGTDADGWMNKIFWGDNLQVMSHLLKQFRGKIDLIYIDPPFDSKADYKKSIKVKGKTATSDSLAFEEKQYGDIWTNDEYLQFIYERLVIMKELLSSSGSIYIHLDYHKVYYIKAIMDEVFGIDNFQNDIIWRYSGWNKKNKSYFNRRHDVILYYSKGANPYFEPFRLEWDSPEAYAKARKQKVLVEEGTGRKYVLSDAGNGNRVRRYLDEAMKEGRHIDDVWLIDKLNNSDKELLNYPTQKPEKLIERIIQSSCPPNGIVFDCFMGSGTTQAVAMKLGRKFIGADINLGAIQTTTKRLIGIADELNSTIDGETKYTGFEVYNVNNYDFFRNPVEARDLIISALDIEKFTASSVYDGELDGRMVKIMPVNRIATKADLAELIANMPYKTFEQRKADNPNEPVERITLVCMGHEPDLKAHLIAEVTGFKLDIEIVDILRDKADLQLKREAEAVVTRKGNKLVIEAFYPMNFMQKLSLQKEYVDDWKQLVESVMVDFNYDGAVLQPTITDIPGKNELVLGEYDIPENAGTIRVKITDLLSESLEVEVE